MSAAVLIDLGEGRELPVVDAAAPSPRRRRSVGLLLTLAVVVAAGAPAPTPVTLVEARVPAAPADYFAPLGDRLYVIGPDAGQTGVRGRTITAYGLPGGERLWGAALPVTGQVQDMYRAAGVLMVHAYDDRTSEIAVLDENSGTLWWRRPGYAMGTVPGPGGRQRLLLGVGPDGNDRAPHPVQYQTADLRTGAVAWSYRLPDEADGFPVWQRDSDRVTRLVTYLPSGRAEVRDLSTGAMIAEAVLRPSVRSSADGAQAPPGPSLMIDGDLVVAVHAPDDGHMTAYGLERLDARWTVPWEGGSPRGFYGSYCGAVVCVSGFDAAVRAVERDTGRTRWSGTWSWAEAWGPFLLASAGPSAVQSQTLVLVDPATGAARQQLGSWEFVGQPEPDSRLLVRHDRYRHRAALGVLDQVVPDVQLLGWVRGVLPECKAGQGSIVCRRIDRSLGIWRYR